MGAVTGQEGFAEAYDVRTGVKTRVPRHFIDDPVIGRFLEKTPAQMVHDGDIDEAPATPTAAADPDDLRRFARREGVDVGEASTRDELLEAIAGRMTRSELQVVAEVKAAAEADSVADDHTQDPDADGASDETPANGGQE